MRPVTVSRTLAAAVANSIALLQTTAGAGSLTLNGALASGGVATIPTPSQITLTSTGNISGVNFTITGTDTRGQTVTEVLAGPNNNTVTSVYTYYTITSITVNGAVATNTSVGNAQSGASQPIPLDLYLQNGSTASVKVTGTVNYTVQVSNDDPYGVDQSAMVWSSHPTAALVAATASQIGTTANAYRAMRIVTNSGSGTAALTVSQQGLIV